MWTARTKTEKKMEYIEKKLEKFAGCSFMNDEKF